MMRLLDGITNSMDMNLGKFWETGTGKPGAAVRGVTKSQDTTSQLNSNNNGGN